MSKTEMSPSESRPERVKGPPESAIALDELLLTAFKQRYLIVAVIVLFSSTATVYALLAEEWYKAEVVLMPAEERTSSAVMTQLGGLANLAGISVGGGNSVEPLAVLRSRQFAREFIQDNELLPVFFADQWNEENQDWEGDSPDEQPDERDAVEYFHDQVLAVSEDSKTGIVTLAIRWRDPAAASLWANSLVTKLNGRMRQQALQEAERNVAYLRDELAGTSLLSMQQSIGRLLETELQKLMLAKGTEEFSFQVIDRATPPKYRYYPPRTLIVVLAATVGLFVGLTIAVLRRTRAGSDEPT